MEKHKLLREDILPAMASNRKVQRLLNEFMDLLSEYKSNEMNLDQVDPVPPTTQQTDSTLRTKDQVNPTQPVDQVDPTLATDQVDQTPVADKAES